MTIPIASDRMLADLDRLRRIGAVGTGVSRSAFTRADIEARRYLAERIAGAGLEPIVDPCGNLFGLPPGNHRALLIGSHCDSQPLGGWLDGAYGVAAGLEIARAAHASGGPPIAVVSFQDEEGWFGGGLMGSAVWTGAETLAEADERVSADGTPFREARRAASEIAPVGEVPANRFHTYLEAHIEQGPVLDDARQAVGVVADIVGLRQVRLRFEGEANHAGTTPMDCRRDAFLAAAALVHKASSAFAPLVTPRTVWTFGRIEIEPGAPSIVPGAATVWAQVRDADAARLDRMEDALLVLADDIASGARIGLATSGRVDLEPTPMDAEIREHLKAAAEVEAPGSWRCMPSGALHDASNVARIMPTGMLFVPSINGISHNPTEDTARADLATGLRVLGAAAAGICLAHMSS